MNSIDVIKEKSCPICGSTDSRDYYVVNKYSYMQCVNCKCVYLPGIDKDIQSDCHKSKMYKLARILVESKFWMHNDWLAKKMESISPGGYALEVGSGAGYFVKKLNEFNYVCEGIDIGTENSMFAEQLLEVVVHNEDFLVFDNGRRYDWIIMNQLIEHVPDPVEFVNKAFLLLKSEGKILITTPNLNFTDTLIKFLRPVGLRPPLGDALGHPPNHCVLFNPSSIRLLLKNGGFKILEIGHNPTGFKGRNIVRLFFDKFILRVFPKFAYSPNMYVVGVKNESIDSDKK